MCCRGKFKLFGPMTLLMGLLFCVPCVADQIQTGEPFPSLEAYSLEGSLPSEGENQIWLIDFWASWCAPCKISFPALDEISQRFNGRGLRVIGVSVDEDQEAVRRFLRDNPISFTIVRDKEQKLVADLAIKSMPTSFIVDAQGIVRYIHNGWYGKKTADEIMREVESLLK